MCPCNVMNMKVKKVNQKEEIDHHLKNGKLQELYNSCFGDPPYEEVFSDDEVTEFFSEYFDNGIVCFCYADDGCDSLVGFAAAVPLSCTSEIRCISEKKNIDEKKTWYYADLGVAKDFRRLGIAETMSRFIVDAIPKDKNILMRTQEKNQASINCHRKIGYRIIDGMTQDMERTDGRGENDYRVFLFYERKVA